MNIRPLYDRIVVKRVEEQESTVKGIVIPDSAKEKPQESEVLAIGQAIMEETGIKLEGIKLEDLGRAKRVTVDKDITTIIDGAGSQKNIEGRRRGWALP